MSILLGSILGTIAGSSISINSFKFFFLVDSIFVLTRVTLFLCGKFGGKISLSQKMEDAQVPTNFILQHAEKFCFKNRKSWDRFQLFKFARALDKHCQLVGHIAPTREKLLELLSKIYLDFCLVPQLLSSHDAIQLLLNICRKSEMKNIEPSKMEVISFIQKGIDKVVLVCS
jgi:hypothetical protein